VALVATVITHIEHSVGSAMELSVEVATSVSVTLRFGSTLLV